MSHAQVWYLLVASTVVLLAAVGAWSGRHTGGKPSKPTQLRGGKQDPARPFDLR